MKLPVQLALIAACMAVGVAGWKGCFRSADGVLLDLAAVRRGIATRVLAEELARQYSGGRALIVSNPFVLQGGQRKEIHQFEEAGVSGLKRGWGDRIQTLGVVYPELRPEAIQDPASVPIDPETRTPLSFLQTPRAWEALLEAHPETQVIVSLIGVPVNLRALELWRRPRPALALIFPDLRMIGDQAGVIAALQSGKLAAVVLDRPGSPAETVPMEKGHLAEFERRFLLITSNNVHAVLGAYPNLF